MTRKVSYLGWAVLSLMLLYCVCQTLVGTYNFYNPVPHHDSWSYHFDISPVLLDGDWSVLWSFHNEHRIFWGRLLFLADRSLFGGLGYSQIAFNLLVTASAAIGLLFWTRTARYPIPLSITLFAMIHAASFAQGTNLYWDFQTALILSFVMPVWAILCLGLSARDGASNVPFAVATVLGFAAALTSANGIATFFVLAPLAYFLGLGWRRSAVLVLCGVLVVVLYFQGRESGGEADTAAVYLTADFWLFIPTFLGSAIRDHFGVSGRDGVIFAMALGLVLVLGWLVATVKYMRQGHVARYELVLLAVIGYFVVSALGAAYGRSDIGLEAALSSRYSSASLLSWTSAILLLPPLMNAAPRTIRATLTVVLSLFALAAVLDKRSSWEYPTQLHDARYVAALAAELEAFDDTTLSPILTFGGGYIDSVAETFQTGMPFVQAGGHSVFGHPPFAGARELLGTLASAEVADTCTATIDSTTPLKDLPNVSDISGSVTIQIDPLERALLLDAKRTIVGVAITVYTPPEGEGAGVTGWRGFHFSEHGAVVSAIQFSNGCSAGIAQPG